MERKLERKEGREGGRDGGREESSTLQSFSFPTAFWFVVIENSAMIAREFLMAVGSANRNCTTRSDCNGIE